MRKRKIAAGAFPIFCFLLLPHLSLSATSLDQITVLKISAQDQSAVVKFANKLRLLKPGDKINENAEIMEIGEGRIVIEENKDGDKELLIIHLENGKQKVERISQNKAQGMPLYLPQTNVK